MAQGIGYMISALGPLTAGLLHSVSGGWQVPLVVTMGICAAQLAAGFGAARPGMVNR
jgi:CP family cyanate transporter-like MFS transporter